MKRNILSLLIALFATLQVAAQTYDNLWKQAEIIAQKDQPKSEIAVMKKIIAKASAAKDYGQLLAAETRQMTLWNEISADSLTPNVKRMEAEVLKVNDPALKAVRSSSQARHRRWRSAPTRRAIQRSTSRRRCSALQRQNQTSRLPKPLTHLYLFIY